MPLSFDFRPLDDIRNLNLKTLMEGYAKQYPSILHLFTLLATLPAASAEVERGFSTMKQTKTDLRSTLTEAHLNELMGVKMWSPDITSFDPAPAIHAWNRDGLRRPKMDAVDQPLAKKLKSDAEVEADHDVRVSKLRM